MSAAGGQTQLKANPLEADLLRAPTSRREIQGPQGHRQPPNQVVSAQHVCMGWDAACDVEAVLVFCRPADRAVKSGAHDVCGARREHEMWRCACWGWASREHSGTSLSAYIVAYRHLLATAPES